MVGEALLAEGLGERRWLNELPEDVGVEADSAQLFRVFHNLGRNAYEAGAREVRVAGKTVGEGILEIDISDDGPGLPERARDHLFQPFEASSRPGGTGLGLAISRDLVRAHGGSLELVASDARGSCFRIRLPAASLLARQTPTEAA